MCVFPPWESRGKYLYKELKSATYSAFLSSVFTKNKCVPAIYFPYSRTTRHPLQHLQSEADTFVILTKLNTDFFV